MKIKSKKDRIHNYPAQPKVPNVPQHAPALPKVPKVPKQLISRLSDCCELTAGSMLNTSIGSAVYLLQAMV